MARVKASIRGDDNLIVREITKKRKDKEDDYGRTAPEAMTIRAKLVSINGSVWADVYAKRVWYQAYGASQPSSTYNFTVRDVYEDMPVIIGTPQGSNIQQVLRVDEIALKDQTIPIPGQNDKHSHRRRSGNIHIVEPETLEALMCHPTPDGVRMIVRPGWYIYGTTRTYFTGTILDLSGNIPAASNHRLVGIYLDANNAAQVVNGTAVSVTTDPDDPTWPAASAPLATVLVRYDSTKLLFSNVTSKKAEYNLYADAGGWPGTGECKIDTTTYASLTAAVTAWLNGAGNVIKLGEGTHTLATTLGLTTLDLTLVGTERSKTIIQLSTNHVIQVGDATHAPNLRLRDLTVDFSGTNATYYALYLDDGTIYAESCDITADNYNSASRGEAYGQDAGEATFVNCDFNVANAGAAADDSAIFIQGGTLTVYDGTINGEDIDIYNLGGSVTLRDAKLTSGILFKSGSGTFRGVYLYNNQRYDLVLNSYTEGNHFVENLSSYPTEWTEVDAAATTNTNKSHSFWYLQGASTETSWRYRQQSGVNIESSTSNYWQSFMFGPILLRDGGYTADLSYYFGMYRNNAGVIDTNTYSRVQIYWNSGSSIWQIRGQENDGSTAHNGTFITIDQNPIPQPLYVRFLVRNDTGKTTRIYFGTSPNPDSHQLLLDQTPTVAPTWGQVWLDIVMARGAGVQDYLYIGAIDFLENTP